MQSNSKNEAHNRVEALLEEIDYKKILYIVYDNKWQVVATTLFAFFIGLFLAFNISPKYVSNALIQVDSQLGSANNMQQMLGNMNNAFSAGGQASPADIEIALIKSPFILQSVIEKLHLNINASPRYFPFIGAGYARHKKKNVLSSPLLGLSQFAWGGEKIKVDQFDLEGPAASGSFKLRADSDKTYTIFQPNGHFILRGEVGKLATTSADSNNKVSILISQLRANLGTTFNLSRKYNDDILKQLSQNLSIVDLGSKDKTKTGVLQISFQDGNPAFIPEVLNSIVDFAIQKNIEKKSAEASKTLDFLNRQLPSVRESLERAETDLNEYRARNGTIDISQEAKIMLTKLSAIEQSIAEVKLKKVELLQELTPQHPLIISLSQKQLQLQKDVIRLENKIKRTPRTDQRAMSLERDVKVKDQLYLLLLNKIQQLQVLKAGTLSDIRVLNKATTPIIPLPSHRSFTLMLSIIIGFVAGLGILLVRELFQHGITNPEIVEERTGIPNIAIIPHSRRQKQLNRNILRDKLSQTAMLLAETAPKDIAIEGIRSLRTQLQFSLEQSKNNIIAILGATPNIGKSFVSTNLSQVLADSGKRILLIDSDMRKGTTNRCLAQPKSPGLAELLTNKCSREKALRKISANFDFIPTGEYPLNPSEILLSETLANWLKTFSQEYDNVLIDTPPTLAVTDGTIIAKYAGVNMMVIASGSDHIQEIELMVKRLKRNGIVIDGFVFNNKAQAKQSYGQYNYYYAYEDE